MHQLKIEFRNSLFQIILAEAYCCVLFYCGGSSIKLKEIVSAKKSQNISPS